MLSEGTSHATPLRHYQVHNTLTGDDRASVSRATRAQRTRPARRFAASAAASLSVLGLAGTLVLPLSNALAAPPSAGTNAALGAAAPATALRGAHTEQELVGAYSSQGAAGLDAVGAVEVHTALAAPLQSAPEANLVDPSELTATLLADPFATAMTLTDGFGYRTAPVAQFHDAQDIAAPNGTPIRVIGDGIVIEAGWAGDGCGFGLKVQHLVDAETLTSRYCHMESSSHDYQVGDVVALGDPAGRVGNTGMSFGSHLHLALRLEGEPIDPLPYIREHSA